MRCRIELHLPELGKVYIRKVRLDLRDLEAQKVGLEYNHVPNNYEGNFYFLIYMPSRVNISECDTD